MNFERIKLLLDVFHATLNVPGLTAITTAALDELREIAAGKVEEILEPAELELPLETPRRF
jgi:hypothetical protein